MMDMDGGRNPDTELQRQVAERTAELQRTLEVVSDQAGRLEKLDAAKSRLFANISHEFRTPLTLTLGPLEDVRAGLHGAVSPEVLDEVDLAIRNSRRQLGLVEQLGVGLDARGNVEADTLGFATSEPGVYAAGDCRRSQSLVVWAQWEGREAARAVDQYLVGHSRLQSRNATV